MFFWRVLFFAGCLLGPFALLHGQEGDGATITVGSGGGDGGDGNGSLSDSGDGGGTISTPPVTPGPMDINSGTSLGGGTLVYGDTDFTGYVLEGGTLGSNTLSLNSAAITFGSTTQATASQLATDPQVFLTGFPGPGSIDGGPDSVLGVLSVTAGATPPAGFDASSMPYSNAGTYIIPTNFTLALPSATVTTSFNSSLTFSLATSLVLSLNTQNQTVGTLAVQGNLTLDRTNLQLVDGAAASQALVAGTTFTLVHYTGTETGAFDINGQPVSDGGTFVYGANTYVLSYAEGDPNIDIMVAPEPSEGVLLLLGMGAVILLGRRRARSF